MSHFDLRRCNAIPDLPSRIFFCTLAAFDYFFSYFNSIIYPPAILPCSQDWEKAHREWQFWLEGKLIMAEGRRWGSFQKLTFLPFLPVLVATVKGRIQSPQSTPWNNWISSWWKNLPFSFGNETVNNFRVTFVYSLSIVVFKYHKKFTVKQLPFQIHHFFI